MFKAYLVGGSIILGTICILSSCDSKEVAKGVAKSEYNELREQYHELQRSYKLKNAENRALKAENKILKGKLEKYANGFKSMYE